MAAWQFTLALVPRKAWDGASSKPQMPIWDGAVELWASERADEWAARLRTALGEPAKRFDETNLMWGAHDSHCLWLSRDDDGGIDLIFRVDLRSRDVVLVEQVLGFARENELLLLCGNGEPVEPRADELAGAARTSAAARFVRDPVGFLEQLSKTDSSGP